MTPRTHDHTCPQCGSLWSCNRYLCSPAYAPGHVSERVCQTCARLISIIDNAHALLRERKEAK